MKTDRDDTYVVKTHWGTFRLDYRSYQDYLEGRSWISYKPGKKDTGSAVQGTPPELLPEISDMALKIRMMASCGDAYLRYKRVFPDMRPVMPYKERMRPLSIDEMPLMTRSSNSLKRAGAHDFGRVNDIMELEAGLKAVRNLGVVSEQDILHCFFNACYERLDDTEKALYWQQMLDRSEKRTVI